MKRIHILIGILILIIISFGILQIATFRETFVLMPYDKGSSLPNVILAVEDSGELSLVKIDEVKNNKIKESQVKFYRKGLLFLKSNKIISQYKEGYYLVNEKNFMVLRNSLSEGSYDISVEDIESIKLKENKKSKKVDLVYIKPKYNEEDLDDMNFKFIESKEEAILNFDKNENITSSSDNIKITQSPKLTKEEKSKEPNVVKENTKVSNVVKYSEITVDGNISSNEEEAKLKPLVISPIQSGGSRIAWMGTDGKTRITSLNSSDKVQGNSITISGNDFSDMYAHNDGGVVMHTKRKKSGAESLLNHPPESPIQTYGMYLTRFNNSGNILWSTELTNNKIPYTEWAIFVWWYAHHGRIAWSGSHYATYYGAAASIEGDIHQGDRETIVSSDGSIQSGGWDWGCSHSGYEYVIWDKYKKCFASICKTDNQNRIMYNVKQTLKGIDLWYSNLSNLVPDKKGGYWVAVSDKETSQPSNSEGYADVHLLHFTAGGNTDKDIVIAGQNELNERSPHISLYGDNKILVGWETTSLKGDIKSNDSNRKFFVKAFDIETGSAIGASVKLNIKGNRYRDLVAFPDGSVAFISVGSSNNMIKIARIYQNEKPMSTESTEKKITSPDVKSTPSPTEILNKNSNEEASIDINLDLSKGNYKWIMSSFDNIFK
ncbi:MAG: hypothetical protein ABF289_06405 [Clostridiales bacterium]